MTTGCMAHPHWPKPLECVGCQRATEIADAAIKEQNDAVAAAASSKARERGAVRKQAIVDCWRCDDDGYRNGGVCNHNEYTALAATKGAALAREVLNQSRRNK